MLLDARIPDGPIETKWERTRFDMKLVNPANKRRFTVIVVRSGLASASAAAFASSAAIFIPMARRRRLTGQNLLIGGLFYAVYVGIVFASVLTTSAPAAH